MLVGLGNRARPLHGEAEAAAPLASTLAAIAAVWMLAASRWLWSDSVVPWDSKNQFYAFFRFLAESLHAGHSIFWNPYHYGGHPSIADPQSFVFSPLFLLWAWLDPAPSLRAFDLVVYAHFLAGGLAIGILGRRRMWPGSASVLAASVFMLGGAASARLNHTGIILCYGVFPLALLTLELALERRSLVHAAFFSYFATTIVLARNQVALLLCFVLLAVVLRAVLSAPRPLSYLRERFALGGAVAVAVMAASAVPVLLTLQLALLSNRTAVTLAEALQASLHPANLASLAAPNVFGSHAPDYGYWGPHYSITPEVGATDGSFNYLFVGAVPIILLLWIGIVGGRFAAPGRRTWTAILVLAFLFALGRYTPLYSLVFTYIPGFTFFRRPVDAVFIVGLAIAFLSGHFLSDYVRAGLPGLRPLRVLGALVAVIGVAAWAVRVAAMTDHVAAALYAFGGFAGVSVLVVAVLALARRSRRRSAAAALVTGIAVAELLLWNAASRLNAEDRVNYQVLEGREELQGRDRTALHVLEEEFGRRHREGARPRVEVVGLSGPWQNLAMVRRFEAVNGYNPLRIGRYDRLVAPGEQAWHAPDRRFPATFNGYDCALARALGLEYLVLDRPIEKFDQLKRKPKTQLLLAGPSAWIYRIPGAMPRVRFHSRVEVADADATTASGDLRHPPAPDHIVVDDETPPRRLARVTPPPDEGRVRLLSWRPGRVEIEAQAAHPGVLILHDVYYPGWVAELDGTRVPVLRADVLFRAVEMPPGRHRVVFRFAPLEWDNLKNAVAQLRSGK